LSFIVIGAAGETPQVSGAFLFFFVQLALAAQTIFIPTIVSPCLHLSQFEQ
jgi:hypothetical protein